MWGLKLVVFIVYDLFDFTIGHLMFATPFVGEWLTGYATLRKHDS
jgi:hypothetical protein